MKMISEDCVPISEWPPPELDSIDSDDDNEPFNNVDAVPAAKRIKRSCSFKSADKLLTGWVRSNLTRLKNLYNFPQHCHPKTIMNFASETPEGQEFLKDALQDILEHTDDFLHDPEYYFIIATYNDKLGNNELALENVSKYLVARDIESNILEGKVSKYLQRLNVLYETDKDALWLFAKLFQEKSFNSVRKSMGNCTVAILDYEEVTVEMFKNNYCRTKTPVVFKNVPRPTKDNWSLDFIEAKAEDCKFDAKVSVSGSTEWAGLESGGQRSVSHFLSSLRDESSEEYLFDWSLPLHCPALDQNFTTPHLVQQDFLKQTSESALYHNSWPSLFIARRGTNSGLHVDAFGSHFWMFLISGKKKWTFYSPEDCGSLNPKFYNSLDPIFRPSQDQLDALICYSVELEPGQLLFVPSGSPHRVENMQDTVAVSGNFVNDTNLDEAVRHLKINALKDPRSEDLLAEFLSMKLVT